MLKIIGSRIYREISRNRNPNCILGSYQNLYVLLFPRVVPCKDGSYQIPPLEINLLLEQQNRILVLVPIFVAHNFACPDIFSRFEVHLTFPLESLSAVRPFI